MVYIKKCIYCGKKFRTKRSHAKTCGLVCRVALHHITKKEVYVGRCKAKRMDQGGVDVDEVIPLIRNFRFSKGGQKVEAFHLKFLPNDMAEVYVVFEP